MPPFLWRSLAATYGRFEAAAQLAVERVLMPLPRVLAPATHRIAHPRRQGDLRDPNAVHAITCPATLPANPDSAALTAGTVLAV